MGVITPTNKSVLELEGLHLYHSNVSNCSMRVCLTLEEKGLPWTSHHLDIRKKEHITEEYFGINPNGLVPTLVHDGKVLIESADIIDYLDLEFPDPPLRPSSDEEIGEMLEWMHRAAGIHLKAVKTHIYDMRMRGTMTQAAEEKELYEQLQTNKELLEFHHKSASGSFTQQELDTAKATLDECFADLNVALQGREWIVGDNFSLADIAWIPVQFTLHVLAGYSFEPYPAVADWAQRIADRPSYKRAILDWWPQEMKPLEQKTA